MRFNKNSFDLLLISFVFYPRNSLEKKTENSGVLLNCMALLEILPTSSLVELHYFQLAFLENCVFKKQKKSIKDQRKSIKDQRKFPLNAFFKVFANSYNSQG